jgi:hypothetical protein
MMTQAKVEAVNKLLLEGEPGNISVDEHASYASTGYKPQFIIDAMNEIFWGEWGFSEIGSEVVSGDKGPLVVSQVQVWLAGIEFKPTSWGQNRVTSGNVGDAKKGAQTDAIKKALSYFSIGNRAYQGLLKEDGKVVQKNTGNRSQQNGTASKAEVPKVSKEAAMRLINPLKVKARKTGFIAGSSDAELIKAWHEVKRAVFLREVTDAELIGSEELRVQMRDAIDRHVQLNQSEQKAS